MVFLTILPLVISPSTGGVSLSVDNVRAHVAYLASDEVEGRMTGSAGERLAGDYIARKFREYGVLPGGSGGTFFQDVQVSFGSKPGPASRLMITLSNGTAIVGAAGVDFNPIFNSAEKAPVSGDVVYVGEGIVGENRDDYAGIDATGKIVVVMNSADQRQFGIRYKGDTAKSKGAAGIIVVGSAWDKGRPLPIISRSKSLARESGMVGAYITPTFFEKVSGLKYAEARTQALAGRAMPNFARGLKATVETEIVGNQVVGRNVIGLIPGNDPVLKNQFVVFGAHYDHLGYGEVGARDGTERIHPGADDNGSGTAGLIELARYFATTKSNRRSVLIQLYTAEELGLRGSAHWVKNPTVDSKAINYMLNFDMIGNLTNDSLQLDGFNTSPDWAPLVDKSKTTLKIQRNGGPRPDSDHYSFAASGVPVLFFHTGLHERYHTDRDFPDKVNYEGTIRVLDLAVELFKMTDESAGFITFRKGNEVTKREPPTPAPPADPSSGRRVRVGVIPSYGDSGPGLLLEGVSDSSPAQKAGLRGGDRITKWNDTKISSIEEFNDVLIGALPGVEVNVTVLRGDKEIVLKLTPEAIGERLLLSSR